jgi:hypothetical protein
MELHVDANTSIHEIQEDFQERFAFLRLGFFVDKNQDAILSPDEQIKNEKTLIRDISKFPATGNIQLGGSMTVAELENAFRGAFGLDVQVFRKSGNAWLMTSQTDNWSLDQQNQKAQEMELPVAVSEPGDYQEHE